MSSLDERLIADYLKRFRQQLEVSPERERELVREVRSHLVDAARDIGIEAALDRFGPAESIGLELRLVHGKTTWTETGMAVMPLFLLSAASVVPAMPWWATLAIVAIPLICAGGWSYLKRSHWPLWVWTWLGCLPLIVPNAPANPLWGGLAYFMILILLVYRDWLKASLALYPLSTLWAFQRGVLASQEVTVVGWAIPGILSLSLAMAVVWALLLVWTLRTPSGQARISRSLQSQAIILTLNVLTVVTARLWPSYPYPYAFDPRYFVLLTVPYALLHGLPYLLFTTLTSLPAISALLNDYLHRQPPSRPVLSG
jgi:hypothetical protein